MASVMGRKLPTINAGLQTVSMLDHGKTVRTHIFHASRLTVKEKQHRISGSLEFGSGFFNEQLVRMAFWVWSKAIAPNFSQYETRDGSAMISCSAILPFLCQSALTLRVFKAKKNLRLVASTLVHESAVPFPCCLGISRLFSANNKQV